MCVQTVDPGGTRRVGRPFHSIGRVMHLRIESREIRTSRERRRTAHELAAAWSELPGDVLACLMQSLRASSEDMYKIRLQNPVGSAPARGRIVSRRERASSVIVTANSWCGVRLQSRVWPRRRKASVSRSGASQKPDMSARTSCTQHGGATCTSHPRYVQDESTALSLLVPIGFGL